MSHPSPYSSEDSRRSRPCPRPCQFVVHWDTRPAFLCRPDFTSVSMSTMFGCKHNYPIDLEEQS